MAQSANRRRAAHNDSQVTRNMKIISKRLFLFLLMLMPMAFDAAMAQKALRNIKSQLKNNQAQNALNAVQEARKDSTLNTNPRLYDYGAQAYMALNDALNEKIYLKQAIDTAQFFNTIYGVYDYVLKCDSLETEAQQTRGKSPKFRKLNKQRVLRYYKNLNAGGHFFFAHGKHADAIRFLTLAQKLPEMPLADGVVKQKPEVAMRNAVMLVRSAFATGDTALVARNAPLAMQSTGQVRCDMLEIMAKVAELSGDVPAQLSFLRQGLEEFPHHTPFFTGLADYYNSQEDYQTTLTLTADMLRVDSTNYYFLLAKGLALISLSRSDEAVEPLQCALVADSTAADVHYYIGVAYCNMAASVDLPENIRSKAYAAALEEQRRLYRQAEGYLEQYRALRPDEKARWVPLLYKIYLALNEGEKFSEIEKLAATL